MNLEKLRLIKDVANTIYHGAKGVEQVGKVSADDTATIKGRKVANAVKHIAMAIEKGLGLRR